MSRMVAHWGTREWRRNQDELIFNPERPQAFPSTYPMDLLGRIRVRLAAEGHSLVAYGFGGQRVELPSKSVGAVQAVSTYKSKSATEGQALLVFDRQRRVLLRANGLWDVNGELQAVCRAARAPKPTTRQVREISVRRWRTATTAQFQQAPGYVRLRTRPRGAALRLLGSLVLFLVTIVAGAAVGVVPAVLLPEWSGAVRPLIGIVGTALGIAGGVWLGAAISHVLTDAVRWAAASWMTGQPAPASRFFARRGEHGSRWQGALDIGLVLLCGALVGWGPGVGITSLVHGLRDASLVAQLRADGTQVQGKLIDLPQYSADNSGNESVDDVPTLSFSGWQVTDPSIGGRPLPLDAADPAGTEEPLTVVYLPDDPLVAAAKQQVTGSVWHGAPTANLISGGLFTLALPGLVLYLVLRLRRRRWRQAEDFVVDLTR
jgi:hypothetical protein